MYMGVCGGAKKCFPLQIAWITHKWPQKKNHSIKHTPADDVLYYDAINVSCEAPATAHKNWAKEQDYCINQGPQVQMTMMWHPLRKEARAMLCEGVQGKCTC